MEEEIKKAYMDWSEKGVSYLNCMYVYDTMMDVDEALQTCDTILDEIDLGIDYTSRKRILTGFRGAWNPSPLY